MQVSVRSYIAAGVVPAVAGLIATTPIAAHPPELRIASLAPRLTASVANVVPNLINDIINIPANELIALGNGTVDLGDNNQFSFETNLNNVTLNQTGVVGLTSDFTYAGNWWVVQPTNVLGTDPGDVPRYQSLVNVLIPIPALSVPLGNAVAAILASQLPMNIGCTETNAGGCNEPFAILGDMFHLERIVAMFSPEGYTFPEVRNPVTCDSDGTCNRADPNGPLMPWSGQTVRISLDPFAPVTPGVINPMASFVDSLMQEPTGITPLPNPVTTFTGLGTALFHALNPFVIGTQCGLCAPFVPGSGVTFAQAIQNSIESILSLIPGYQGPLPSSSTTSPVTTLAASAEPQTLAGKALGASSTTAADSAAAETTDTTTAVAATAPHRGLLKTALSEASQAPAATAAATDESADPTATAAKADATDGSQEPAADAPVRKHQPSTASATDTADSSTAAKQPGTAKSVADHLKAAVDKVTGSKTTESKASDSKDSKDSKAGASAK